MKRLTVRQTHAICDSLNARAVIVLAFGEEGQLAGASYGETKLECSQIAYTMDRIIEGLDDGSIPTGETAETMKLRSLRIKREMIEEGSWCGGCDSPVSDYDCDDIFVGLDQSDELINDS